MNFIHSKRQKTIRYRALSALGKLKEEGSVDIFINFLSNGPGKYNRAISAETLAQIGNEIALDPLFKAASNDNDSYVRRMAAINLAKPGDVRAANLLKNILEQEEYYSDVGKAYADVAGPEAVGTLIKCYQREFSNGNIADTIITALEKIGTSEA